MLFRFWVFGFLGFGYLERRRIVFSISSWAEEGTKYQLTKVFIQIRTSKRYFYQEVLFKNFLVLCLVFNLEQTRLMDCESALRSEVLFSNTESSICFHLFLRIFGLVCKVKEVIEQ